MNYQVKYFLTGLFLSLGIFAFSQNEASKWYFGNNAGLNFMTSPPTVLTNGALVSAEGSASIADAAGNLLFYTDGATVYNKFHIIMANGLGLMGNPSASQSALIVKQPGNTTIYFVFTLDETSGGKGLRYSVVDMSVNGGIGAVTSKNILVQASSTEKLCGVKHCNGTDVWVVSHDYQSDNFRANLVTSAGVNMVGVLSAAGPIINTLPATQGCMKISPTGKNLGVATFSPGSLELYDFSIATGAVSNYTQIPLGVGQGFIYNNAYSCEFSPDGKQLYATFDGYNPVSTARVEFLQWDICGGIYYMFGGSVQTGLRQMQLAPDGNIYVVRVNTQNPAGYNSTLHVINNPNIPPGFFSNQSISPKTSTNGLPNFVSGFYRTHAQFTSSVNAGVNCLTASFAAPLFTCSATSYSVDQYAWSFGDPASGAANTSTLANPAHIYPGNGIYNAKLIMYNECGGVIDSIKQQVMIAQVPLTTTADFAVCLGNSITLTASGLTSYSWSTGATTNSISVAPTSNTSYTIEGSDVNGCQYKSVKTITVNVSPVITVSGTQTVCTGSAFTQTASGANSYTWSNGATGPVLTATPSSGTAYTVTGSMNGCLATAVSSGTIFNSPQLILSGTQSVCLGSGVVQTVTGANSYTWSTGVNTNTALLTPVGTLSFQVAGTGTNMCIGYRSVTIICRYLPAISITGNHSVCPGAALTLTAIGASDSYNWSTGTTTEAISVSPTITTNYVATGTDSLTGCKNTSTVTVNVAPSLSLAVSSATACSGATTTLSVTAVSTADVMYTWLPDVLSGTAIPVSANATRLYTIVANANGCTETTTTTLYIEQAPTLNISPSLHLVPGTSTTLHASGATSYNWLPAEGLSCNGCDSPVASPSEDTHYCVYASNGNCKSSACLDIIVSCETNVDFSLPNAFTPNSDYNNDAFCLQGWNECTTDFAIQIYDRWGELVYSSNDPLFCWDGTFKGQLLNAGVFVYVVHAKIFKGEAIDRKGNITLIR